MLFVAPPNVIVECRSDDILEPGPGVFEIILLVIAEECIAKIRFSLLLEVVSYTIEALGVNDSQLLQKRSNRGLRISTHFFKHLLFLLQVLLIWIPLFHLLLQHVAKVVHGQIAVIADEFHRKLFELSDIGILANQLPEIPFMGNLIVEFWRLNCWSFVE